MAIISCHECGKDVSTTAKSCPHCGAVMAKPKVVRLKHVVGFIGVIALIFFIVSLFGPPDHVQMAKQNQRRLIEACWKEQSRKSLPPELARGFAAACEQAEADLQALEAGRWYPTNPSAQPQVVNPTVLTPEQKKRAACFERIEQLRADYDQAMKRKQYLVAAEAFGDCADRLEDPFLQDLVAKAKAKVPAAAPASGGQ